ncbi:MAG: modification methylase [Bacteroidetes bacterium]|nr:MAG: modification methylase [Bacteroidota bacterium]
MNYIGSKIRLLPFLEESITQFISGDLSEKVFCDLFAGTGTVGSYFKTRCKSIIANDLEYYSYVLNRNYIGNHKKVDSNEWLKELEELKGKSGFIYMNYCKGGHGERNYFNNKNGKRIDAVRQQIQIWKENEQIDEDMYFFLLATLLESADKIANTASVYGAYLKSIKKIAAQDLSIVPAIFEHTESEHKVYHGDANVVIKEVEGDILYLDPPYNSRQYGGNYHLLNTIAEYKTFEPKGVTGLPPYNRSTYSSRVYVKASFEEMIANAKFKYIFLSYNNEGLMSHKEISEILLKHGKVELKTQKYKRFKADRTENRNHGAIKTVEYLFCLEKK